MPVAVPESIRKAWGDEAVADFVPWFEATLREQTVPRDEYRTVLSRLDILEHDVKDIKGELRELRQEMNERFDRMNERFDRMNERFDQMYDGMLVQTRWLIGSLALIGTVISVLLAIGQFVK
jgi:predicted nuclease with TOPRIM domain